MTIKESRNLATSIARTSDGVVVKLGVTNGRNCLHLVVSRNDGAGRRADSVTIYSPIDWQFSKYNNRPRDYA
jgi:hypothetical protein